MCIQKQDTYATQNFVAQVLIVFVLHILARINIRSRCSLQKGTKTSVHQNKYQIYIIKKNSKNSRPYYPIGQQSKYYINQLVLWWSSYFRCDLLEQLI